MAEKILGIIVVILIAAGIVLYSFMDVILTLLGR